jgi:hypothetical protein
VQKDEWQMPEMSGFFFVLVVLVLVIEKLGL